MNLIGAGRFKGVAAWLPPVAAHFLCRGVTRLTSPETIESVDDGSVGADRSVGVILTTAAIEKIKQLLDQEGRDDLRLRVAVQPGGCSGLRYQLYFDDRLFDSDHVARFGYQSGTDD